MRPSRSLLQAQVRAFAVLGATLDLPGTRALARLSQAPTVTDSDFAGTASTIVRPGTPPPWPALVFVNGATPDGRTHPMVLRLSLALARSGQLVFIPDLPGIAGGELSPATLRAATAYVQAAADSAESRQGRIGLAGVSVGASLALLAAAAPGLAERVSVVACVAPFTDMANVMLLATTGTYRAGQGFGPYPVPAYLVGGARAIRHRHLAAHPGNRGTHRRAALRRPGSRRPGCTVSRPLLRLSSGTKRQPFSHCSRTVTPRGSTASMPPCRRM